MAYGVGDFAAQLVWTTTSSYLAIFYTDTVGIAAGVVAVLLLVTRILDAVIDPVIGAMAERTRSRFGRFRPWILYGSGPLAIFLVLTFTALPTDDEALKVTWAAITYGILGLLYSAVTLPISALAGVISANPDDRVGLGTARMIGANLGIVVLSFSTVPLIVFFSGGAGAMTAQGYFFTAVVMAVVAVPMFLFVVWRCREVVKPSTDGRVSVRDTIRTTARNFPLLLIALAQLIGLTAFFGRLAVSIYYLIYNVQEPALIAPLMATPAVFAVIGMLVVPPLAVRWGRRPVVITSFLFQAVVLVALYLVGWDNLALVIVLTALYGFGFFGFPVLVGMIPDAIDYAEDRTGIRADGTGYAVTSFGQKMASAIGAALGVAVLGAYGYAGNQEQTPLALAGINVVTNLGPAIFFVLAIVPLFFYRIRDTDTKSIRIRLDQRAARHGAAEEDPRADRGTQS